VIRVFDGHRTLPLLPPGTPAIYLFSDRDLPDPELRDPHLGFGETSVVVRTLAGGPVTSQYLAPSHASRSPARAVPARFGDSFEVTGFDAPSDAYGGQTVTVRWFWQVLRADDRDLTFSINSSTRTARSAVSSTTTPSRRAFGQPDRLALAGSTYQSIRRL
jgi:hypothetical protein